MTVEYTMMNAKHRDIAIPENAFLTAAEALAATVLHASQETAVRLQFSTAQDSNPKQVLSTTRR